MSLTRGALFMKTHGEVQGGQTRWLRWASCLLARPPPDIIAPGGNGHPGPTRSLTLANNFLTSCPAFQPPTAPHGGEAFVPEMIET